MTGATTGSSGPVVTRRSSRTGAMTGSSRPGAITIVRTGGDNGDRDDLAPEVRDDGLEVQGNGQEVGDDGPEVQGDGQEVREAQHEPVEEEARLVLVLRLLLHQFILGVLQGQIVDDLVLLHDQPGTAGRGHY